MNKNIAILTLPLSTNFGGNLQAFALQKILLNMGFEVETLNYRQKMNSDIWKLLSTFKQKIFFNKKIHHFFRNELHIIGANHEKFIKENLVYSPELNTVDALKKYIYKNNYDVVIVGSDQVWRLPYSQRIYSYFLDFIDSSKIKKISYAASFGVDYWEFNDEATRYINQLMQQFSAISVRENSAINLCNEKLNVENVKEVLDPTLLLNVEDYEDLYRHEDSISKGKIFSYILDSSLEKEKILTEVVSKINKEVVSIQPSKTKKESLYVKDLESYVYPKIEIWLKGIAEADFVVTDSFHGTVFAILHNKPFISIINKERGAARFYSLLSKLNLIDRIISDHNDFDWQSIYEINYKEVNNLLERYRSESYNFLLSSLGE